MQILGMANVPRELNGSSDARRGELSATTAAHVIPLLFPRDGRSEFRLDRGHRPTVSTGAVRSSWSSRRLGEAWAVTGVKSPTTGEQRRLVHVQC